MANNAVYAQLAPAPVRCNEPPIDVATASDAALKAHFENLMECLVRVWQPPLTQAGFQIFRPTVTIYVEEITTKCGSGKFPRNAFYCGADQQIYWSNTLGPDPDAVPGQQVRRRLGDGARVRPRHPGPDRDPDLAELAAVRNAGRRMSSCSCGGGPRCRRTASPACSCARSRSPADSPQADVDAHPEGLLQRRRRRTQRRSRRSSATTAAGASRRYWGTTGLGTGEVGKCNTFVAPSNQVR